MAYTPTTWVDGTTSANAARLNNMEAGIAAARTAALFSASCLTSGTLTADTWVTVPHDTVATNNGGGSWNTSTFIYTVPTSGLYLITASLRLQDSAAGRSFAQGVGTANADGPTVFWTQLGGFTRNGMQYSRLGHFNSGDLLRHFLYSETVSVALSAAGNSLTVALLQAD